MSINWQKIWNISFLSYNAFQKIISKATQQQIEGRNERLFNANLILQLPPDRTEVLKAKIYTKLHLLVARQGVKLWSMRDQANESRAVNQRCN